MQELGPLLVQLCEPQQENIVDRRGQEKLAVRLTKLEGRNLNIVAAALGAIKPRLSC